MSSLAERLKERKRVQWAIAYAGAALCLSEVLRLVAGNFGWSALITRSAIVLGGIGFFSTLVLAWYLRVISRTSVMEYRDTPENSRVIGQELGAEYPLEGGAQRAGERVLVTAQLVDAETHTYCRARTASERTALPNSSTSSGFRSIDTMARVRASSAKGSGVK